MTQSILFSFLLLFLPGAQVDSITELFTFSGESTTTGVGFGRPTNACDGIGICVVSSSIRDGIKDNFGNAEFTFGRNGQVSEMFVLANSLTKNTIKKHFSEDHFTVIDPFESSLKIGDKEYKLSIASGKYKIKRKRKGFLIQFKV